MTLIEPHPRTSSVPGDPGGQPRRHRFTREEYYKMGDLGFFRDQRVELFEGVVLEMAPQKNPHMLAIGLASAALSKYFGTDFWIRIQGPLRLGASEPEPDLALVAGHIRSFKDHPDSALLVIEVSDSTLRFDRSDKAGLYARAKIADYWIVNLQQNCLEVYRDPISDPAAPLGHRYQSIATLNPPQSIAPLANPSATIAVADLLP